MCDKRSSVRINLEGRIVRVDNCLRQEILDLNQSGLETLACCCGHGRYSKSVVVQDNGRKYELISGADIPRKRRFYVTDNEGFYFIPEILEARE